MTAASVRENLGPAASDFAGFLREDLSPALGELWAWIQEHVNPVVGEMGALFRDDVLPAVGDGYQAFKRDLLPILKELWAFIDAEILPIVAAMAATFPEDWVPAAEATFDIFTQMVEMSWGRLIDRINDVRDAVNFLKDAAKLAQSFLSSLGVVDAPSTGRGGGGGGGGSFHTGGTVPGSPGSEYFGATLLAGEEVLSVRDARIFRAALATVGSYGPAGSGISIGQIVMSDRPLFEELSELQSRYGVLV